MTSDQADEENFAAIVSELDWVAALDMAEEPWQLAVICRTLQPPEFAQRRTPYKRGRDMVAQYLSRRPGRADLVQQMWDKIKLQLIA